MCLYLYFFFFPFLLINNLCVCVFVSLYAFFSVFFLSIYLSVCMCLFVCVCVWEWLCLCVCTSDCCGITTLNAEHCFTAVSVKYENMCCLSVFLVRKENMKKQNTGHWFPASDLCNKSPSA